MNKKEFTKHYINILHCPDLEKYPERTYDLKDEIQRLADIDKISYSLALSKICDAFLSQYLHDLDADPDGSNFRQIETATNNLVFLRCSEGENNAWITKNQSWWKEENKEENKDE